MTPETRLQTPYIVTSEGMRRGYWRIVSGGRTIATGRSRAALAAKAAELNERAARGERPPAYYSAGF